MLPLSDVIPPRTTPHITLAIVGVSALVLGHQLAAEPRAHEAMVSSLGLVPAHVSPVALLTSPFVHVSGWHFATNMLGLWLCGESLEDRFGRGRFFAFYLLCGAVAALTHVILHRHSAMPVVGATGALAGVIGGYFVTFPQSRLLTLVPVPPFLVEVPAAIFLAAWWAVQVLSRLGAQGEIIDVSGGLSFWALVAAFVAGALACLVMRRPHRWGEE
jgi:membrane associated rhomboid family serine protease